MTRAAAARAAGISASHLSEIEDAKVGISQDALQAVAIALGRRVTFGVPPSGEPLVRDHRQAPMIEALLRARAPRWDPAVEVPVYRPVHGVIDLVLTDPFAEEIVAFEAQSELRRLESIIRWSAQKADALLETGPFVASTGRRPRVSRVLAIASTPRNREIVEEFGATIRAAYPARAADVFAALTGAAPWPGSGLIWVSVHGASATVLPGNPRGMRAM